MGRWVGRKREVAKPTDPHEALAFFQRAAAVHADLVRSRYGVESPDLVFYLTLTGIYGYFFYQIAGLSGADRHQADAFMASMAGPMASWDARSLQVVPLLYPRVREVAPRLDGSPTLFHQCVGGWMMDGMQLTVAGDEDLPIALAGPLLQLGIDLLAHRMGFSITPQKLESRLSWMLSAMLPEPDERCAPLLDAVAEQDMPRVRELLKAGVDANTHSGGAYLLLAALDPDPKVLLTLLEAGAYVNFQDPQGLTALMVAAAKGHANAVAALIQAGAKVDWVDPQGRTALDRAEEAGHAETARLLREAGANASPRDAEGETPAQGDGGRPEFEGGSFAVPPW